MYDGSDRLTISCWSSDISGMNWNSIARRPTSARASLSLRYSDLRLKLSDKLHLSLSGSHSGSSPCMRSTPASLPVRLSVARWIVVITLPSVK